MSRILFTGGTGTLGREAVSQVVPEGIYRSRHEPPAALCESRAKPGMGAGGIGDRGGIEGSH